MENSVPFYIPHNELTIPKDEATAEKLAYYNAILLNSGDAIRIEAPNELPVNVVRFDKNYEKGYLTLPTHGGGYYLEVHDTPHLWSHLDKQGGGYVFLGKKVGDNTYHPSRLLTFLMAKPFMHQEALYIAMGLLIGNIYAIYTVTEHYSTAIIISPNGLTPTLKIPAPTRSISRR